MFPDVVPSREDWLEGLATALRSDKLSVYLDASLLIQCYEISPAAGAELLQALEGLSPGVHVPVWAAQETWEYIRSRTVKKPLDATHRELKKAVENIQRDARRFVDDDTLPDLSKTEYQAQLDNAAKTLVDISGQVAPHEPKADRTTDRLLPFIEQNRLNSDLNSVLAEMAALAPLRFSHKIPPGFGDGAPPEPSEEDGDDQSLTIAARKGRGKKRNLYGDLINWLEILRDVRGGDAEHLLILTKDLSKGDWVYVPTKVRNHLGKPEKNEGTVITIPQPLLVHEADNACPTLKSVNIISAATFAQVLITRLKRPMPYLAAALQAVDESDAGPMTDSIAAEALTRISVPKGAVSAEEPLSFGSADMTPDLADETPVAELLRSLSFDDWRTQNQAILTLEPLLPTADRRTLMQTGRSVANAINAGARDPFEFVQRAFAASSPLSLNQRSHLLIGILAEIYINEEGEPKKPVATEELAGFVYKQGSHQDYKPAYVQVMRRLETQRAKYLALPDEARRKIEIQLIEERNVLRSARVGDVEILEEQSPESRRINQLGRDTEFEVSKLIAEFAREFVVPPPWLEVQAKRNSIILVPEHLGYVVWGPQTGTLIR